jgi:hypothetical protein
MKELIKIIQEWGEQWSENGRLTGWSAASLWISTLVHLFEVSHPNVNLF